ncbi:hypothetical protein M446_7048 (plasmid) [Methylobacterium sp. 4-46]|uniref:hypothetical protein n=1 Tax=Methylobacterium sp. (strain 4-46) TaxID=426117 RepID=UPI000152D527|nr:hypothetical protein [Methylobacterium sp. 4-46]ACA21266.1 hypothetical protein M446_7048 [Methylobacterium sp. 4-46]
MLVLGAGNSPTVEGTSIRSLVPLTILVDKADRARLRHLAVDENTSVQQLGLEAWSTLLARYDQAPMSRVKATGRSHQARRDRNGVARV